MGLVAVFEVVAERGKQVDGLPTGTRTLILG